jgi:hypothetical protein
MTHTNNKKILQAERLMLENNLDKEYAGITGIPSFTKSAGALAYGEDSPAITGDRVSGLMTRKSVLLLSIFITARYCSIYLWYWCSPYWW